MIKLIALDLDGTLVPDLQSVDPKVIDALSETMSRGVKISLATGREYTITAGFAQQLAVNAPLICYQGALVRDYRSHKILYARHVPAELARRVIKFARHHKLAMLMYTLDQPVTEYPTDLMRDIFTRAKSPFVVLHNLLCGVDDTNLPLKFLFVQPAEKTAGVEALLASEFDTALTITKSLNIMVEMTMPQVSKGDALAQLAAQYNLTPDEIMAVGDQDNDVTMLQYAGIGVAMGNASSQAKAVANDIAPSVDDCGVVWALEKYVLNPATEDLDAT